MKNYRYRHNQITANCVRTHSTQEKETFDVYTWQKKKTLCQLDKLYSECAFAGKVFWLKSKGGHTQCVPYDLYSVKGAGAVARLGIGSLRQLSQSVRECVHVRWCTPRKRRIRGLLLPRHWEQQLPTWLCQVRRTKGVLAWFSFQG